MLNHSAGHSDLNKVTILFPLCMLLNLKMLKQSNINEMPLCGMSLDEPPQIGWHIVSCITPLLGVFQNLVRRYIGPF